MSRLCTSWCGLDVELHLRSLHVLVANASDSTDSWDTGTYVLVGCSNIVLIYDRSTTFSAHFRQDDMLIVEILQLWGRYDVGHDCFIVGLVAADGCALRYEASITILAEVLKWRHRQLYLRV